MTLFRVKSHTVHYFTIRQNAGKPALSRFAISGIQLLDPSPTHLHLRCDFLGASSKLFLLYDVSYFDWIKFYHDFVAFALAALVIKSQQLSSEYETTNAALLKYHKYLAGKYDTPDTLQEVQAEIRLVAGKMAPLAHIALELRDQWTLYSIVPASMHDADPGFWAAVGDVAMCLDTPNADCTVDQSHLENEGWKNDIKMTPEELVEWEREMFHGESPSESQVYTQSWFFPPAFASHKSYDGSYTVRWTVYSDCNDEDEEEEGCDFRDSLSTSGYRTDVCGPESDTHMPGKKGTFRVTVTPTGSSDGAMSWLDHAQFGDREGQGSPHYNPNGKATSATTVTASKYAHGFGWNYDIECTTYAVQ